MNCSTFLGTAGDFVKQSIEGREEYAFETFEKSMELGEESGPPKLHPTVWSYFEIGGEWLRKGNR